MFEFYCPSDPVATAGPALVLGPGSDEAVRQRLFEAARQEPGKFNLRLASLRDGFTRLHEGNRNLLVDSDLSAKWGDGSTRDKLIAWVKRFAESVFPDINATVVQCVEEFENAASESEARRGEPSALNLVCRINASAAAPSECSITVLTAHNCVAADSRESSSSNCIAHAGNCAAEGSGRGFFC